MIGEEAEHGWLQYNVWPWRDRDFPAFVLQLVRWWCAQLTQDTEVLTWHYLIEDTGLHLHLRLRAQMASDEARDTIRKRVEPGLTDNDSIARWTYANHAKQPAILLDRAAAYCLIALG